MAEFQVAFQCITVDLSDGSTIDELDTKQSAYYKAVLDSKNCDQKGNKCIVAVGFMPTDSGEIDATFTIGFKTPPGVEARGNITISLSGTGIEPTPAGATCHGPSAWLLPLYRGLYVYPTDADKTEKKLYKQLYKNFGVNVDLVNCFYQTSGQISYFDQIQSIYNGASGSATVAADIATLNFRNGMQLAAGTNIQAGGNGSAAVSTTTNNVPTLSSSAAAQAAQNILYGGTIFFSGLLPVLYAHDTSSVGRDAVGCGLSCS